MALSLAACGGSDDAEPTVLKTVYDAAVAAQTAAEAEAAAAATAKTAAEAAQAAAEADAATAAAAQAAAEAEATAAATAKTAAEAAQAAAEADAATAAAAQAAAEAAQAAAEADAAAAATAQAAAEAAQAAAEVEAATAAAEAATATEAQAAAEAAKAAAEAAQAAAEAETAALTSPVTVALTTDDDVPSLSAGNDTITGTSLTYEAADVVVDGSSTDADTLTVTATGDVSATPTVVKVETLNFDLTGVAAAGGDGASTFDVDVSGVRSAQTLNFDITAVGSSVSALAVDNIAAGGVVINATSDFTTVTIDTVADADYTLNVGGATATTDITVSEAEDSGVADDVTINSTSALSISSTVMDGDLVASSVGDMDVENATSAEGTVTLTSSAGSILVTAANGTATMSLTAADEVDVEGATAVTTLTMTAAGTAATSATTASQVTATAMTTLNVSGNGAAVKVDASASDALAAVNVSGAYSVEVVVDGDELKDISNFAFIDTSTAGTSVLNINAAAEGGASVDLVDAGADVIKLTADMNGDDLDVATGAVIQIAEDQTATEFDGVYASRASNTISVTVNDDAESAESWDVTSIDFDNFATVTLASADTSPVSGGVDVKAIDAGTATLKVTGSGTFQFDSIVAGSFDGSEATGALDLDLEGSADVATVTTGSGNDTIVVSADLTSGGYTINAGSGNDGITLVAGADQTVDGGDGVDTATLDGDYTAGAMSLSSIEIIELDHDSVVDGSMMNGQALVVRDSTAEDSLSNMIVTIDSATADLSNVSMDSTTHSLVTINGGTYGGFTGITVVGTNIANTITGGSNGDALTGGAGIDTIAGAAGNDVISGLAAADILTGGAGADTIDGGAAGDTIYGGNAGNKESATFDLVGSNDGAIADKDVFTMTLFGETITVTESAEAEQDLEDIGEAFVTAIGTAFGDLITVSDTVEAGTVVVTSKVDGVYTAFAATVAADAGDAASITAESTVEGAAGSDGADIITGGEGADLIFAGAGANTIDLSEAVAAADVVHFTEVGADVTTITGFAVNSDKLDFNGHESTDGEAVVSIAANASSANPTTGSVVIFADGADGTGSGTESVIADYTDLVDVAAFIEAGVGIAASETFIVMINDLANDNVYIYNLENDGDTAAVASTDLDLIGVVSNIGSTALDANDIVA